MLGGVVGLQILQFEEVVITEKLVQSADVALVLDEV